MAATLQLGTAGPGIQLAYALTPTGRLAARVGVHYVAYRRTIRFTTSEGSRLALDPDVVIGAATATLKWHPLARSSFFVAAGGGYTWRPDQRFRLTAENNLKFGGLEMAPGDVGTIDARLRWRHVVGYAGLGFGRTLPKRPLGVGVELGTYYLGRPRVALTYDGFLETTNIDEQLPIIERNLSGYRFLPVLNVTLTYAFR